MRHWGVTMLVVLTVAAHAQESPYVRKGSIGAIGKDPETVIIDSLPRAVPIDEWTGRRFILLPKPKSSRRFPYMSFEPPLPIAYEGAIITARSTSDSPYGRVVEFDLPDGKRVRATAYSGSINEIGLVDDLDYAKKTFLGKTVWLKGSEIVTYDDDAGKFGSVKVPRLSAVQVVDVVAGWYEFEPVRFVFRSPANGEGFLDSAISKTNMSSALRNVAKVPEDIFFTEDPHQKYRWSSKVWDAIGNGDVFVGMTAEQAQLSWGRPRSVNRTSTAAGQREQWVYGDGNYVYVEHGVVTAIQN